MEEEEKVMKGGCTEEGYMYIMFMMGDRGRMDGGRKN